MAKKIQTKPNKKCASGKAYKVGPKAGKCTPNKGACKAVRAKCEPCGKAIAKCDAASARGKSLAAKRAIKRDFAKSQAKVMQDARQGVFEGLRGRKSRRARRSR